MPKKIFIAPFKVSAFEPAIDQRKHPQAGSIRVTRGRVKRAWSALTGTPPRAVGRVGHD